MQMQEWDEKSELLENEMAGIRANRKLEVSDMMKEVMADVYEV